VGDGQQRSLMRARFRLGDLPWIRRAVYACAIRVGLNGGRAENLVVAVNEALTNSVQHGGGVGEVVLSCDPQRLVAEITDEGPGPTGPVPQEAPPVDAENGRGLWLIRELVDRVSVRRGPGQTTLRLEVALKSSPASG